MTEILSLINKFVLPAADVNSCTLKKKCDVVEVAFQKFGSRGGKLPSFPLWKKTHSQLSGISGQFEDFLTMEKLDVPGRPQYRCSVTEHGRSA